MPKNKIGAHANAVDFSKIARQPANKYLARLLAELFIELDQQNIFRSRRLEDAQFLRQRINKRRRLVRRDHHVGMLVKCQDEWHAVVLVRVGDRLAKDLLVPQMDAVKKTDGQANFFAVR